MSILANLANINEKYNASSLNIRLIQFIKSELRKF